MPRRSARIAQLHSQKGSEEIPQPTKRKRSTKPRGGTVSSVKEAKVKDNGSVGLGLRKEKGLWDKGMQYVVGVDEAGRGPLAGRDVVTIVLRLQ